MSNAVLAVPQRAVSVINQEYLARKIASIMGSACSAALALSDYGLRTAAGETVIIFCLRGKWVVGPESDILGALNAAPRREPRRGVMVN